MDLGIIIAISAIGVAMIGSMLSMMFWTRSESNSLRNDAKEDRKYFMQISRNLENIIISIEKEMRDFHFRLLEIEKGKK